MADHLEEMRRGFALSEPGDPLGVSCDAKGPSLGPVRLLEKTAWGLWPRPVGDLDAILGAAFGEAISCESLMPGLESVARALNAKDMTRAIFATRFMQLPDLTVDQARRAVAAEALRKAAVDDEEHPGWPAKTPDGKGGQFRPKTGGAGDGAPKIISASLDEGENQPTDNLRASELNSEVRKDVSKRAFRMALGKILNVRRWVRLAAEAALEPVPFVDAITDAMAVEDLLKIGQELKILSNDLEAMNDFLNKGAQDLKDLHVNAQGLNFSESTESFSSMDAFVKLDMELKMDADLEIDTDLEKRFGPAGDGYEYHHIVEQGSRNNNDITAAMLNSPKNIVRIPKLIHQLITGEYARAVERGGPRYRNTVRNKSFEEQYKAGLDVMERMGMLKNQHR